MENHGEAKNLDARETRNKSMKSFWFCTWYEGDVYLGGWGQFRFVCEFAREETRTQEQSNVLARTSLCGLRYRSIFRVAAYSCSMSYTPFMYIVR